MLIHSKTIKIGHSNLRLVPFCYSVPKYFVSLLSASELVSVSLEDSYHII
jgi:hypothetical protein